MRSSYFKFRFMGFFKESPPLHFYLMQAVAFLYLIYRFASRDYSIYGFLPEEAFTYLFDGRNELLPLPLSYFFTGQFIYSVLPHPGPQVISGLQYIILISGVLGLTGLWPRLNAIICLLLASHITGIMQSCDGPFDGGTVLLSALFVLALSPQKAFYSTTNGYSIANKRGTFYHWPITLLFILIGCFYTFSGLAKLLEIGPNWPFVLHLENLVVDNMEKRIFLESRYSAPFIDVMGNTPIKSIISGIFVFVGELFFIGVLWWRNARLFLVFSMIGLHVIVFYSAGINFLGSSLILLLLFDFNRLQRTFSVVYSAENEAAKKMLNGLKKRDRWNLLQIEPQKNPSSETEILSGIDEDGATYSGMDALEQIWLRMPLTLPLGILAQIPGIRSIIRWLYSRKLNQ